LGIVRIRIALWSFFSMIANRIVEEQFEVSENVS
jgi:hypothetical protein